MAYIGAETPNNQLLKTIRKGTRSDQTLEVADLCRRNGVIPELSFMVAPPEDPEGETERTFDFIRQVKKVNPQAEIIVYIYTPLPAASVPDSRRLKLAPLRNLDGEPVIFPATAEEWTERRWVDYSCHADAPWLTPRLRQRIRDFNTVLGCRFPTVQDIRVPTLARRALRVMSAWRYRFKRYDRPWELNLMRQRIVLHDPKTASL
jgi:anaerobic magnesium-protoporphyrin IX monomethyl ester cyclase